jgi:quercetin dioxygenase-like cupin family protein
VLRLPFVNQCTRLFFDWKHPRREQHAHREEVLGMSSDHEARPHRIGPDEGEALWILGGLYEFRAKGADSEGEYTVVEVRGPQGFVIPLHLHERENEGFYVASGQATIFLGDDAIAAPVGSFAFAPRGLQHTFRLDVPDTRLLLLITPGAAGHEGMFAEMGELATTRTVPPPPTSPPDPELLGAVAARHGTRIVGPPPS